MAKGTVYDSERAIFRDARSGLRVFRLTHGPCIATNLYFEMCSFTTDDRYVVFRSQRFAGRGAPFDLYRARTDGLELVQLTERDDLSGIVFCSKKHCAFYVSQGKVFCLDILSLEETVIAEAPYPSPAYAGSLGAVDQEGRFFFSNCLTPDGDAVLYRVDVANSTTKTIFQWKSQNHIHCDPTGAVVSFNRIDAQGSIPYLVNSDGTDPRPWHFRKFAHCTWFGTTGKMQGTLVPPGDAIVVVGEHDPAPQYLARGRYYWHSSASLDAQWIISDTNWPEEGLFLVHCPTGSTGYVCETKSSCSHPQWTHPHPSLSPGMRFVLFNSDMTGIGQVYLAELTEEFLEKIQKGYECKPVLWA